jgi:hypothetical protein
MITEYFKNPKPIERWAKTTHHSYFTVHENSQAMKLGMSPYKYRQCCEKVKLAFDNCKHKVGDIVYPYSEKEYKKNGKMFVQAICKHFDDYGDVMWNDPPYILQVASVDDPNNTTACTSGWVQAEEPGAEGAC